MPEEPVNVETTDFATFLLTTPVSGRPALRDGPIRGDRQLILEGPSDLIEQFIARMRRLPARRNRPRIYVDGLERDIPFAEGVLPEDDEEEVDASPVALAPGGAELIDRRQELARVEAQIREERDRLKQERLHTEREIAKLESRLEAAQRRFQDTETAALEHHAKIIRTFAALDLEGQETYRLTRESLAQSMSQNVELRRRVDELLAKEGYGELIDKAFSAFDRLGESSLGRVFNLQISALTAKMAAKMGGLEGDNELTARDAMAAYILAGRQFNERCDAVTRFANYRPRCLLSQGALIGMQIARDDAKLEDLLARVKATEEGDLK